MTSVPDRIRVVFFGTPAYAERALMAIADDPRFEIALVVTQPDRPAGRGRALQAPAVKVAAQSLDLPVYQPESLRSAEARAPLEEANADIFLVAAYGLIFGRKTLAIPRLGSLNLHASLLPKYRGASPVTAAILAGDSETGVTLMQMDEGMDTGGMIATATTPIHPKDTTGMLIERLAQVGAELAIEAVPKWVSGEVQTVPQPKCGATLVRPLVKADGWIDWTRPAAELERHIRAMQPWPRAWTTLPSGASIQILDSIPVEKDDDPPGTVRLQDRNVEIACGDGALRLLRVQPAGSDPMEAQALIQGRRLSGGEQLGINGVPEPVPPLVTPVES